MKYSFLLIISLFPLIFNLPQVSEYDWRVIETDADSGFNRIQFSDSLHGWAIGINYIYHSNDGGETWKRQTLPADTFNLREFCFLNENVGYIIGEMGVILKTSDGGKNWHKQESGANKHYLMGLSFIDENTGWVTGEMDDGVKRGGILLHTTNGGVKWDTLSDRSDMILYYDVKFADENNGIVIGSYGFDNFTPIKVYRTYNGGKNLIEISEFYGAHTRYLFLNNIDTLWTGCFGFTKSFDGGFTWDISFHIEITDSTLYGGPIFFNMLQVSGKTGWAVLTSFSKDSELLYTDDYAFTWKLVDIPEDFHPTSVTAAGKYLFVGGAYGLIMTNKPSTVDVEKEKQNDYAFDLFQNYPNPFNPITKIKYALPAESYVELKIYDMMGREVRTLVNGYNGIGYKEISWDGKNNNGIEVSSSIYLYYLSAKSLEDGKIFEKYAKMLLLK
ncbi:MAG: hypothetical protein C4539_13955 [Ignavibacteriales bacterium]|nr:MAG: hypothetical protein C4539_13955 [Ignavibacteriales bacterium]